MYPPQGGGGYPPGPPGYGAPPPQQGYGYGAPPGANPYAPPTANPYGMPMGAPMHRQQHPKAMTALILGGLAWFLGLWLILSVPAWIIGARAVNEIRANPQQYSGETEAKIGMWLGIVHTVLGALVVLGVVLVLILAAATH